MVLMCMYFGVMVLCVMLRVMCKRYKEFKNSKISCIHDKTLLLSSICENCSNKDEKIFEEENLIGILVFLV